MMMTLPWGEGGAIGNGGLFEEGEVEKAASRVVKGWERASECITDFVKHLQHYSCTG